MWECFFGLKRRKIDECFPLATLLFRFYSGHTCVSGPSIIKRNLLVALWLIARNVSFEIRHSPYACNIHDGGTNAVPLPFIFSRVQGVLIFFELYIDIVLSQVTYAAQVLHDKGSDILVDHKSAQCRVCG